MIALVSCSSTESKSEPPVTTANIGSGSSSGKLAVDVTLVGPTSVQAGGAFTLNADYALKGQQKIVTDLRSIAQALDKYRMV